jgi:hypothetical protein
MDQLSTGSADMSRFIGALEIGNLPAFDDGTLEASGTMAGPNPGGIPPTIMPPCRHVDDSTLEAAGLSAGPTQTIGHGCQMPMTILPPCRHIDDGALEAASGMVWAGPTRPGAGCPMPVTITAAPMCHHADDGVLEAAADPALNQPRTIRPAGYPLPGCI